MVKGRPAGAGKQRRPRLKWLLWPCLALGLFLAAELSLSPIIATAAAQEVHSLVLRETAAAVNRQVRGSGAADYQELMRIERDNQGYITLIVVDTALINALISDVILAVEANLEELGEEPLSIPLGAVTGSSLLAGLGPDIGFRFSALAAPQVRVEDSFLSAGINQTLHSVYLHISSEVRVLAPFSREGLTVDSTVLLAEAVIVGYTPDTYVTLDGGGLL